MKKHRQPGRHTYSNKGSKTPDNSRKINQVAKPCPSWKCLGDPEEAAAQPSRIECLFLQQDVADTTFSDCENAQKTSFRILSINALDESKMKYIFQ
mmetsp:Transcript_21918/g.60016  ORF Transcript_21918/g.60016 Transcript_21918/m.60016 type:complete len:96 (+) Transcript_21918:303-590(+)